MRISGPILNVLAALAVAPLIAACASDARSGAMAPPVAAGGAVAPSSPGFAAISVGAVTGGSETNPLWRSEVSNASFRDALQQSLAQHGMAAAGPGRYRLDAELVDLDQPLMGFNVTVTATVHYTLTAANGATFDQTVETPYTAKFADSIDGVERYRLADEGAMRVNIATAISHLQAALQPSAADARAGS